MSSVVVYNHIKICGYYEPARNGREARAACSATGMLSYEGWPHQNFWWNYWALPNVSYSTESKAALCGVAVALSRLLQISQRLPPLASMDVSMQLDCSLAVDMVNWDLRDNRAAFDSLRQVTHLADHFRNLEMIYRLESDLRAMRTVNLRYLLTTRSRNTAALQYCIRAVNELQPGQRVNGHREVPVPFNPPRGQPSGAAQ